MFQTNYSVKKILKYCIIYEKNVLGTELLEQIRLLMFLYIIQGFFLIYTGTSCFPENIEASDRGYGGPRIPALNRMALTDKEINSWTFADSDLAGITREHCLIIDGILSNLDKTSNNDLLQFIQSQEAWKRAIRRFHNKSNIGEEGSIIDLDELYDSFSQIPNAPKTPKKNILKSPEVEIITTGRAMSCKQELMKKIVSIAKNRECSLEEALGTIEIHGLTAREIIEMYFSLADEE